MNPFADHPAMTPHLGLPLLFVGQAQKEFFVNQSLAVIDAVMARSAAGTLETPPTAVTDGACYIVGPNPSGAWIGREHHLALAIGGGWHFVMPQNGCLVFDRTLGQVVRFDGAWQAVNVPSHASGGMVIDAEARALLAQVIDALAKLGLVAGPSA